MYRHITLCMDFSSFATSQKVPVFHCTQCRVTTAVDTTCRVHVTFYMTSLVTHTTNISHSKSSSAFHTHLVLAQQLCLLIDWAPPIADKATEVTKSHKVTHNAVNTTVTHQSHMTKTQTAVNTDTHTHNPHLPSGRFLHYQL